MTNMRTTIGCALLCMATVLAACNGDSSAPPSSAPADSGAVSAAAVNTTNAAGEPEKAAYKDSDYATDWTQENPVYIKLNGTAATIEGTGAKAKDKSVAITSPGTYVVSGTWEDGQITVEVADTEKVRLVLNGADLTNKSGAALYIKEADKVTIVLQEGTTNKISDGANYAAAGTSDDEPNAAVYSKADLTLTGTGSLIVRGNYNDGLTSKDDLKITGGTIEIHAVDDGLLGRDLVAVKGGTIAIEAGGDGIKTTNDTDASKGSIAIEGGSFRIKAGSDGLQSAAAIRIDGGTYDIVAGGGSANGAVRTGNERPGSWGGLNTAQQTAADDSPSTKGIKAAKTILVTSGTLTIDSSDDAVHSNGTIAVAGGELRITSGDDGIHADTSIAITGGSIDIAKSYEGIESSEITITDGIIRLVASDDGINIAGGNDGSSVGGRPGQNNFTAASQGKLVIRGGSLTVDAAGDGLDSNGSIDMTGGTVIVNGPTSSGNGALDYDGTFTISGGTLIAAGSAGMAMAPSEQSAGLSVLMTFSQTKKAGTVVELKDSSGNVIVSATPSKAYQTVVFSSPALKQDTAYTLYAGGTKIVDFNISGSVTWLNESGVTSGRSAGPGGAGGNPGMNRGRGAGTGMERPAP